jgi:uncharacterized membrane protein (UPF0127 family)
MFSALAVMVALLASPAPATSPVPTPVPTPQHLTVVTVHAPRTTLMLEVARTEAEHERGLMGYTSLPEHAGMIFIFAVDGPVSFWMKDTLIPLDMAFVGADGRVRKVFARVPTVSPALSDNQIPLETAKAKYVIELSAGEAAKDGITAGARLPDVIGLAKNDSALSLKGATPRGYAPPTTWGPQTRARHLVASQTLPEGRRNP